MKCKKTHFIKSGNGQDKQTGMTFNASKPDFVLLCEKQQVGAMEGPLGFINTFIIFEKFRDKKHSIIFLEVLENKTKKAWLSFFNEETSRVLKQYLEDRKDDNPKLFLMANAESHKLWSDVRRKTGLKITPQRLREWFCCEMVSKSVSDSYVDSFCGRIPRSILAKHYLDYSPERMKEIYDKADLRILEN